MDANKIEEILKRHKRWLEESDDCSAEDRADLSGADLREVNLRGVDLRKADLHEARLDGADLRKARLSGANLHNARLDGVNLYGANLYEANLDEANLCRANLRGSNLYRANLFGADLCKVDLYGANLREAYLHRANMRWADSRVANFCMANLCEANLLGADLYAASLCGAILYKAELKGANLYGADLQGAYLSEVMDMPYIPYACPDFGSFVGFKKASGYIVMLEIPAEAKRLSATWRKCRCNIAKVIEIQNIDGTKADIEAVASNYDKEFIYRVGEIVKVDNFNEDRWDECSAGIHFFIDRQEAVEY